MANLQGLKSGSYLERKGILHSVFINAKWPAKLLRDFSCSDPHFLLCGHPWDSSGKQGSHFLISCNAQQTRLKCLISCCSLPCLQQSRGKTTHHPQTGTTTAISVLACCESGHSRTHGAGGGEGWGGLDANTSICMASACPAPAADPSVHPCKASQTHKIVLLPHSSVFPKINSLCMKIPCFCRTCGSEVLPCAGMKNAPNLEVSTGSKGF